MIQQFICRQNHSRLFLFFAGWGMDIRPFQTYTPVGADLMVCYDYRSLDFNRAAVEGYTDITLIAWSMGVWAASVVVPQLQLPVSRSIAVNGTCQPVDETRGIQPAIFQATLEQLDENGLRKFYRRMCDSGSVFTAFSQTAPERPLDELREELENILRMSTSGCFVPTLPWDEAYIATRDRIFTPQNQQRSWNDPTLVHTIDEGHYCPVLFKQLLQNE